MMQKTIFQSLDIPNRGNESVESNDLNRFLDSFDPISKKFDCVLSGKSGDTAPKFVRLPASSKTIAARYAQVQYFDNLTKSKYSSIADNLRLVYGDTYVTKKDVLSYHLTESKIIQEYLGIQNLDKLFDEDFFNFEWDIHTQPDFSSHKHGHQRDHFIHQIRNMWEMDTMLEQYGFYEASKSVLEDKEVSPISRYVSIKCKQFLEDGQSEIAQLVDRMPVYINVTKEEKTDYLESWFYKYVIFGASYLAALFHDLGYPVVHFLNMRQRLSEYSPASNMFVRNGMPSFDSLSGKLSDSLLFTIESGEHIRKSMDLIDGKYDHGVYSALPFLLHFYDSGLIYRLSPEKVCAIELAAVAIYSHNLSMFNCTEKDFNADYYKPYFNQNPITFLLRTCDDMQEWDRRYFEITGDSDLLFCPDCHHPLMKRSYQANDKHRHGISEPSPKRYEYVCACEKKDSGEGWWNTKWPTRQEDFLKRKIFLIRACDRVTMEKVENPKDKKSYILKVGIEYDLYRLLELSRFSFAKFRNDDLNKLKKRLSGQNYRFQSGCDAAPEAIYLDYFLSANPITIKVKILEKWLALKGMNFSCNLQAYDNDRVEMKSKIKELLPKCLLQFIDCLNCYLDLLYSAVCESGNLNYLPYPMHSISNPTLREYTEILIGDCFRQYREEKKSDNYDDIFARLTKDQNAYEKLNKDGEDVEDIIAKYCYPDTDFNMPTDYEQKDQKEYKGKLLNYYEDLFIFYWMNEEIVNSKESSHSKE